MSTDPFARYDTRTLVNTRQRLCLADPVTGEDAGDWLDIRYSLADDYAEAREQLFRSEALSQAEAGSSVERSARIITPLIAAWSFDVEPSAENVFAFLCCAPHLHNAIIEKATTEGKLFSVISKSSANGQKKSSNSTASQKAPKTE